jgi:glutaredoxin-related protein
VGSLKTGGQWVEKRSRLPDVLFENDCITIMTGIDDTPKTKFARHNIKTMLDMKMMTTTEVTEIMNDKEFRVSEQKLHKWQKAPCHADCRVYAEGRTTD